MRNILIATLTVTALLAHSCWMASDTLAATRVTEDLADLFRYAQLVVEADVVDAQTAPPGREGVIMTRATLKVSRVIKGDATVGSTVTAEYLGGRDGDGATVVPGQAALIPGARTILLLSKFKGIGAWRVVGGDAGQIDISGDSARRTCGAPFSFYVKDAASLTGFTARKTTELDRPTLDALLQNLGKTGRPEIEAAGAPALKASAPASQTTQTIMPAAPNSNVLPHVQAASQDWSLGMGGRIAVTMFLLLGWVAASRWFAPRNASKQ